MIVFHETKAFSRWLERLKDARGKARILARLRSASLGNFGDAKPVGAGVSEMRIDFGPGYRVYYARKGELVYLLLCGGDKSTQSRDIERAKELWQNVQEAGHDRHP